MPELVVERCDRTGVEPRGKWDRVIFFDRDGVLNIDHGYVSSRDRFEWVAGALEAISNLDSMGIGVGIITNQSGIGRGYYRESEFLELMEWVCHQAPIRYVAYCPHAPEAECPGRKPGPLMVQKALTWFGCPPDHAVLVGDKESDMEAARNAGIRGAQFTGGDLFGFVQKLL
ncbi:MAG: HAD-IIIA family hydrolase [Armatimonadetes bacterium]|nr:HAD-IIIA family hydrolase [Armatimonadota bacterium]MBS1711370.1 HAD-IIIA family hydrolase [Armatimonadota bacterium]MBX3107705.1 HAD-IIIA family hydrolase [Fimbriimonadaceae bacterium]